MSGTGLLRSWGNVRLPSITLLLVLFGLIGIGIVFVHSATAGGDTAFPGPATKVHLSRIALGLVLLLVFLRIDYRHLEQVAAPLYLMGLVTLGGLVVARLVQGGVVRWIHLPFFTFQPSEPMKLFTILLLARYLKPSGPAPSSADPWRPLLITALPVLLIAVQPDLGTALIIAPCLLVMLWISGIPGRRVVKMVSILALIALPAAPFFLKDYQKARVLTFVKPYLPGSMFALQHMRRIPLLPLLESDLSANLSNYQVQQSITAIGSGGPTGKGLYLGTINYLDALPENHNDFIFAVVGEEWGLVGTLSVLALFLVLFLGCLRIAYRTREPYGRLVVIGITTQLAFQTIVNLAMTIGLAPVTGLPLPFLSYGGSAMITSIASLGIVLGIGMRPVRILHPDGLQAGTSAALLRPLLARH